MSGEGEKALNCGKIVRVGGYVLGGSETGETV